MTAAIETCTPATALPDVAQMMAQRNIGAVPVVGDYDALEPIGIITDHDIVVRALTNRQNPAKLLAADCMSVAVVTTTPEAGVDECARLMDEAGVGRVVVVDDAGHCAGIVTRSDLHL
jgi:CBS domain-containing protein